MIISKWTSWKNSAALHLKFLQLFCFSFEVARFFSRALLVQLKNPNSGSLSRWSKRSKTFSAPPKLRRHPWRQCLSKRFQCLTSVFSQSLWASKKHLASCLAASCNQFNSKTNAKACHHHPHPSSPECYVWWSPGDWGESSVRRNYWGTAHLVLLILQCFLLISFVMQQKSCVWQIGTKVISMLSRGMNHNRFSLKFSSGASLLSRSASHWQHAFLSSNKHIKHKHSTPFHALFTCNHWAPNCPIFLSLRFSSKERPNHQPKPTIQPMLSQLKN